MEPKVCAFIRIYWKKPNLSHNERIEQAKNFLKYSLCWMDDNGRLTVEDVQIWPEPNSENYTAIKINLNEREALEYEDENETHYSYNRVKELINCVMDCDAIQQAAIIYSEYTGSLIDNTEMYDTKGDGVFRFYNEGVYYLSKNLLKRIP